MENSRFGIFLIAIGIFILLGNFGLMNGSFFLLAVGTAFILVYLKSNPTQKKYGLLIPGNILLALGVFNSLEDWLGNLDGPVFFILLGIAFMAVHILHQLHKGSERDTKWAMITGMGMLIFAAFIFMMELTSWPLFATINQYFWPIALIGVGAYMLLGKKNKPPKGSDF